MIWLVRYLFLIRVHPHACVNKATKLEDPRTRGPLFAMLAPGAMLSERPRPIAAVEVALDDTRGR